MVPTKRCRLCGFHKPLHGFYKKSAAKDGRQSACKPCAKEQVCSAPSQTPEAKRQRQARYRALYPDRVRESKNRSRRKTNNPVSVAEKPCRVCRRVLPAEEFYRNRTESTGLTDRCRDCHRIYCRQWIRDRKDIRKHRTTAPHPVPRIEDFSLTELYDRDQGRCHICKKRVSRENFTMDHLVPLSAGGSHTLQNVRIAHRSCNSSRGDREVPLFEGAL